MISGTRAIGGRCVSGGDLLRQEERLVGLLLKRRLRITRGSAGLAVAPRRGCMSMHQRVESERFRPFAYEEMMARGRANLGIIWLKDESFVDAESVPPPEVIAVEIVEDLQSVLNEFTAIAEALRS
jgi:hypothetical protein